MATGGGGAMIHATFLWLNDPLNWTMTDGILDQLVRHVQYSLIALAIAVVVGLPLGLLIGHANRARFVVSAANGLRSLPSVGLLILFFLILASRVKGDAVYLVPTEIVLGLLAIPPVLANTFAGVQNVDPAARDAARGMGMTGSQVLWRVELPNALPLIFSGLRSATLQVIATATIAAYIGLGGFGRFVYDGLAQQDVGQRTGGAILVAALAVVADVVLALVQRYTVSPGITGRGSGRRRGGPTPREEDAATENAVAGRLTESETTRPAAAVPSG